MNNLEYSYIIEELHPLVGKHFNRLRKINENTYRMKIGATEVLIELGIRIHKTKYLEESKPANKFIQKAEKELDNAKLLSIKQVNNDRILCFSFTRGELMFEMFGKGNAMLVQEGKIVEVHRRESWAGREIKPGEPYTPPKTTPSIELQVSERYIISSLLKLPLGKNYALEILTRLSIDEKKPGNELDKSQLSAIEEEVKKVRKFAEPYLFYRDNLPVDFSLTPISKYFDLKKKQVECLSSALDEYYAIREEPDENMNKLKRRLEKQKKQLLLLKEKEKNYKEKGNHIYSKYIEIEEILKLADEEKFDEIEKKWGAKINKKEKSIEVDL